MNTYDSNQVTIIHQPTGVGFTTQEYFLHPVSSVSYGLFDLIPIETLSATKKEILHHNYIKAVKKLKKIRNNQYKAKRNRK